MQGLKTKMKSTDVFAHIDQYKQDPQSERLFAESEIGLTLAQRFIELRKRVGLTQEQLADRVGRSQPYIAKLESGAYDRCYIGTLRTFARALGHDVDVDGMFKRVESATFSNDVGISASLDAHLRRDDGSSTQQFLTELSALFFLQSGEAGEILSAKAIPDTHDSKSVAA